MLSARLGLFAALTTFLPAMPLAAEESPASLQPISSWSLDYAEGSCSLRRAFGDQARPVYLELRQFRTGSSMQITILGETLSTRRGAIEYVFGPDSDWKEIEAVHALRLENGGAGVRFNGNLLAAGEESASSDSYLSEERFREREAGIMTIGVRNAVEPEVSLAIGSLEQAMTALRTCTDDLMEQWGIDPATYGSKLRPAAPENQSRWGRRIIERYPSNMVRRGENGIVDVLLIVGPDGRAERCVVTAATAHPDLQEHACNGMLEHARFEPALDQDGQPTRDFWATTVIFWVG